MTITINGSSREVAELIGALLNDTEIKAKKPYFPQLTEELTEDKKIKEFSDEVSHALNKMNEVAKQRKENAPQDETVEQDYEIRYLNTTADELEKTAQNISERSAMIESMRS